MRCSKPRCPREAAAGSPRCERCVAVSKVYETKVYQYRLSVGLCTTKGCDSPPLEGRRKCEKHRQYYNKMKRIYRKQGTQK